MRRARSPLATLATLASLASLTPLALLAACGGSSPRDGGLDATPADSSSRAVFTGPASITLGGGAARVTLRLDRFGMQVSNAAGRVLLDTLAPDAAPVAGDAVGAYTALGATHTAQRLRPAVIEGWDHVTQTDDPWLHGLRVAGATWDAASASVDLFDPARESVTLHLAVRVDGDEVRVDTNVSGDVTDGDAGASALNRMGQAFVLPPDEHFFGFGERYVYVDQRGQHLECWTEEGGIGGHEGDQPGPTNPGPNGTAMAHAPVPFLLSTRGYGLWLDTTFRTGFSLGSDAPVAWRLYAAEPGLHYRVLVHDDPRDTIAHFTQLTGRAHLPAPWAFGVRHRYDHGTQIGGVDEFQALRDHDVPITALDDASHFLPNGPPSDVPGRTAWAQQMHALGYKAIAYFNAYVSTSNPGAADLLAYGRAHDYFVRAGDGSEFDTTVVSAGAQSVATIDLTNPDAVAWFQSLEQQALDIGYDGWMLDFGEYIPPGAVMHDGRTGWEAHNAFPVLLQRATYDLLSRARGTDFFFFSRSGYTGTQAYTTVLWSGDPSASFEPTRGLPGQVRAALNAGLSGIPFWGSDVSGYTCLNAPPVDKDLFLRWAEFGALSTDMHDENACAQAPAGFPDKWSLWSDAETTDVYARYARLHTRLLPYLYAAAKEAQDKGLPVMRHPVLLHPAEADAAGVQYEYYFGDALYVAPVVERAATTRALWLPPGRWFDWWTLEPLAGGAQVTRDAPLDTLPLFLRAGAVVPMLDPSIDTLASSSDPSVVSLDDVAGVLDVRAAVDPTTAQGHGVTVEGDVFDVALGTGAVALPAGIAQAPDEASLASCAPSCGRVDPAPGGALRVRVTLAPSADGSAQLGALTLRHHAPRALRVRWDVVVLPSGQ